MIIPTRLPIELLTEAAVTPYPVIGDYLSPTAEIGDVMLAMGQTRYTGPSLYVIDMLGQPVGVHADQWKGIVRCTYGNPDTEAFDMSLDAFHEQMKGRVIAIVRHIDWGTLEAGASCAAA